MAAPSIRHRGLYTPRSNAYGSLVYDGTTVMRWTATALTPGSSDGTALGSATLPYADLFLASGAVINFNNGNMTITHSAAALAIAGGAITQAGNLTLSDDSLLRVGTDGDGALLNRSTTLAANTALTSVLIGTPVAQALAANSLIISNVTASGDIAIYGNLGGNSQQYIFIDVSAAQLFLDQADVHVMDGQGVVIGHTAQITGGGALDRITGALGEFQVLGNSGADGMLILGAWNTTAGFGATINILRSKTATIGSFTILASGDNLGQISWTGDDGVDYQAVAAFIAAEVDGTPGVGDMPGRLLLATTADGSEAATERWRIDSVGNLSSAGAVTNVTADGAIIATGGIAFTDVLAAWIDDATHGAGTTTIYIGNQTITTSSDMRVKTDIVDWKGSALDLLRQGRLKEFNYDLPGGGSQTEGYGPNARGRYIGMLAQETIAWAPWIVNAGAGADCQQCLAGLPCEKHSPWGVEYQHLVPLLVKGIQELEQANIELKKELASLKA